MLSLGRKPGEYIVINGNIFVKLVKVGNDLRLAIEAPKDITILRGEVYERESEASNNK